MFGTLVLLLPELFTSNAPLCVIMSLVHTAQRRQFFFPFREKVHLNWDIMAAKITSIFFSKL